MGRDEMTNNLPFPEIIKNIFFKLYIEYSDKLPKLFKEVSEEGAALEERELSYYENSFGITEIISCPVKAELRRKGIEPKVEKFEIADGFIFETIVKFLFLKIFGKEKVEFEKLLDYELTLSNGEKFYINGHLDVFIDYNIKTKIGVEIKNTVLHFDNKTFGAPDPVIVLDPEDIKRVNISPKYILQARIQRFILERLYPDSNIEQYLLIKTNLRTKTKLGKSLVLYPIVESISEQQLKQICERFYFERKPRAVWECKVCAYKDEGYCNGIEITENDNSLTLDDYNQMNIETIEELINKREELRKEIKSIEDEIKKRVNGNLKIGNKVIGWVEEEKEKILPDALNRILKEKGIKNRAQFFQVNYRKIPELRKLLGDDFEKIVLKEKVKKLKL